jgi:DNA-binding FadR family transcriptional regulator
MPPTPKTSSRFARPIGDAPQQIAFQIRRHIVQNDLKPGDRVGTEHELAAEFSVSRPTIREALRLLAGSHLIRVSRGPGGGVLVAATPNDGIGHNLSEAVAMMLATKSISLRELMEARVFLEAPLAGLAAANATDETVDLLEQAIAASEGLSPGSAEYADADAVFHRTIAATAGNDLLLAFTVWIRDVLQPSLVEFIGPTVTADAMATQHAAILKAIKRREPVAAEKAMRAHVEHMSEALRRLEARQRRSTRAVR